MRSLNLVGLHETKRRLLAIERNHIQSWRVEKKSAAIRQTFPHFRSPQKLRPSGAEKRYSSRHPASIYHASLAGTGASPPCHGICAPAELLMSVPSLEQPLTFRFTTFQPLLQSSTALIQRAALRPSAAPQKPVLRILEIEKHQHLAI